MTDDMIRSMKGQMVPSDDVVSDLLAKIAALDASPETSEHVVSFDDAKLRRACEDLTASQRPAAKAKKHTTKSIWYYSTAAVAGVIVLLSTITLFGDAEGGKAWDFIHSAINDQTVVTSPVDPDADASVVTDPTKPDDRQTPADSEDGTAETDENKGGFLQNLFGKKDNAKQNDTPVSDPSKAGTRRARIRAQTDGSSKDSDNSSTTVPPIDTADNRTDDSGTSEARILGQQQFRYRHPACSG